ncbi:unnamed protein product [Rotaria sp. Silwood2]|nr:unnamed protein product [Rotaria sp. Silwood2]CAF3265870.1 unnamed protein product [Rotaria sp. Silwood2]CAF3991248.1 unnamed protein product [Rotaria sp. Silwood2]CAF4105269.1 unnamed protein product [Rotaria sp. Silwood2]
MPTKIPRDEEQRQLKQLELEIQYHEHVETMKENTNDQLSTVKRTFTSTCEQTKIPKKRGPKKKQMTPSRIARFKVRRIKANGRERERMKGLNEQLERLSETIPCFSLSQKLSKIETLRLAKNYIEALTQMISSNQIPDNVHFAELLCQGLSPNTINLIAATLSLNPRILQQNNNNNSIHSTNMMAFDDTYMLSAIHPRVKNPLEFINLKKLTQTNLTTSESEDDTRNNHSNSFDYATSSYCGDSSIEDMSSITLPEHSTNFYSNEQQSMFTDHSFYYYPTHY